MKSAGSVKGFKHKKSYIELIRAANIGRIHSNRVRNKISDNSATALPVMVKDVFTGNTETFTSIRRAANYAKLHHSYIAKCLVNNGIYEGKNIYILQIRRTHR